MLQNVSLALPVSGLLTQDDEYIRQQYTGAHQAAGAAAAAKWFGRFSS
jgi:hypothetical protein